ncbi:hypothetical protein GCM10007977_033360 [Dactylosporangium sucinum]|uniref:Uncharacterized protein n=1 Tax=Dactylosporangium sucinum TaxID=1424081 RepID=A0A917TNF8_9ACTN|nr:hypothetical protein GCM10007977_033360 [Dactylosporangium sucinum]
MRARLQAAAAHVVAEAGQLDALGDRRAGHERAGAADAVDQALVLQALQGLKVITFEFSHFLSPNSVWPAARNLYDRYTEYVSTRTAQ